MPDVPIQMHVNRTGIGQQFAHQNQTRGNHRQIRGGAVAPGVGVGELLDDGGFLFEGDAGQEYFGAVVGFGIEGRINVDQVDFPSQAGRVFIARQKRRHRQKIIAVNQAIRRICGSGLID